MRLSNSLLLTVAAAAIIIMAFVCHSVPVEATSAPQGIQAVSPKLLELRSINQVNGNGAQQGGQGQGQGQGAGGKGKGKGPVVILDTPPGVIGLANNGPPPSPPPKGPNVFGSLQP
jgi:hypothetical protein